MATAVRLQPEQRFVLHGVSWQTYVILGKKGSGVVCLNGPPARHFQPGDKVIIFAEAYVEPAEMDNLDLTVVIVEDDRNKVFHREIMGKSSV